MLQDYYSIIPSYIPAKQAKQSLLFLLAAAFLPSSCLAMAMLRPHKLFVYGTLKRGFYNHEVYLKPAETSGAAKYLGVAQTCDPFALKVLGPRCIPALLEGGDGATLHSIEGEVYEITDAVLQAMDLLEGVALGCYHRANKSVRCNGSILDCWVYLQKPQEEGQSSEQRTYPVYIGALGRTK